MEIVNTSKTTLYSYLKEYREGGIEKLKELNFRHLESELDKHRKTLEEYFNEHPPVNVKEAMSKIEELTGIKSNNGLFIKHRESLPERIRLATDFKLSIL